MSKPSDGYHKQLIALASEVMVVYMDAEKLSPINAFFAVGLKPQIITTKIIPRYAKATALFLPFITSPAQKLSQIQKITAKRVLSQVIL